MGLGQSDPWVESHMWPQQTWGQRSSRGQWPLVQVFEKRPGHPRSLYPHTLMYFRGTWTQWSLGRVTHVTSTDKSYITMIVKICDRESRWDLCFENRLVKIAKFEFKVKVHYSLWAKCTQLWTLKALSVVNKSKQISHRHQCKMVLQL